KGAKFLEINSSRSSRSSRLKKELPSAAGEVGAGGEGLEELYDGLLRVGCGDHLVVVELAPTDHLGGAPGLGQRHDRLAVAQQQPDFTERPATPAHHDGSV